MMVGCEWKEEGRRHDTTVWEKLREAGIVRVKGVKRRRRWEWFVGGGVFFVCVCIWGRGLGIVESLSWYCLRSFLQSNI
jgi:hypothetical protein